MLEQPQISAITQNLSTNRGYDQRPDRKQKRVELATNSSSCPLVPRTGGGSAQPTGGTEAGHRSITVTRLQTINTIDLIAWFWTVGGIEPATFLL